ncbi:hypothetical protein HY408_01880 [Candidatus Gottesmanbacteria bacterium]|nr:hypothetical protein [Candidatus Gottesmanbacteria bacterium]
MYQKEFAQYLGAQLPELYRREGLPFPLDGPWELPKSHWVRVFRQRRGRYEHLGSSLVAHLARNLGDTEPLTQAAHILWLLTKPVNDLFETQLGIPRTGISLVDTNPLAAQELAGRITSIINPRRASRFSRFLNNHPEFHEALFLIRDELLTADTPYEHERLASRFHNLSTQAFALGKPTLNITREYSFTDPNITSSEDARVWEMDFTLSQRVDSTLGQEIGRIVERAYNETRTVYGSHQVVSERQARIGLGIYGAGWSVLTNYIGQALEEGFTLNINYFKHAQVYRALARMFKVELTDVFSCLIDLYARHEIGHEINIAPDRNMSGIPDRGSPDPFIEELQTDVRLHESVFKRLLYDEAVAADPQVQKRHIQTVIVLLTVDFALEALGGDPQDAFIEGYAVSGVYALNMLIDYGIIGRSISTGEFTLDVNLHKLRRFLEAYQKVGPYIDRNYDDPQQMNVMYRELYPEALELVNRLRELKLK